MTFLQQLLSIAGATITILGAIFGVFLWLLARFREVDARFREIEGRLHRIERRLDLLQVQAAAQEHRLQNLFRGMTAMVGVLSRVPGVPQGELTRAVLGAMEPANITKIVQSLETGNPFTTEEGQRLYTYYEMARRGDSFTADQARDFYALSDRATKQLPTEEAVWTLLFVAGILLAIAAFSPDK